MRQPKQPELFPTCERCHSDVATCIATLKPFYNDPERRRPMCERCATHLQQSNTLVRVEPLEVAG